MCVCFLCGSGVDSRVFAGVDDVGDEGLVLQAQRQAQRLGVLAQLAHHRDANVQHLHRRDTGEIQAGDPQKKNTRQGRAHI